MCFLAVVGCGESNTPSLMDSGVSDANTVLPDAALADAGMDANTHPDMSGELDMSTPVDAQADADMGLDLIELQEVEAHLRMLFCAPVAVELCEGHAPCRCERDTTINISLCINQQQAFCEDALTSVSEAIVRDELVVDDDTLRLCAAQLAAAVSLCSGVNIDLAPACALAINAVTPLHSVCSGVAFGRGCAAGAGYCDATTSFICEPVPLEGEPCTTTCKAPSVCREGVCSARVDESDACTRSADCADGMICHAEHCVAPGVLHAFCDPAHPCGGGLRCADGSCEDGLERCSGSAACLGEASCVLGANVCRPLGVIGDYCDFYGQCAPGLTCDFSHTRCVLAPSAGDPCSGIESCDESSVCVGPSSTTRTCQALPVAGNPCVSMRCAPGSSCEYVAGMPGANCVPLAGEGGACSSDESCMAGLVCVRTEAGVATCEAPLATGAMCFNDACMETDFCEYVPGAPGMTCNPKYGVGSSCFENRMCAPGLTCYLEDPDLGGTCEVEPLDGEACTGFCASGAYCSFRGDEGTCLPNLCDAFTDGTAAWSFSTP